MKVRSTAHPRRAGALLVAASLLAGCAGTCPRDNPPPPPPGGPWQHAHRPGGPPRDPAFHAAMQACVQALGVEESEDAGPAQRESGRPDRARLEACLREKGVQPPPPREPRPRDSDLDAAFQACRAALGLDDEQGPPPPGMRRQIDACLEDKGIIPLPPPPPDSEGPPPAR